MSSRENEFVERERGREGGREREWEGICSMVSGQGARMLLLGVVCIASAAAVPANLFGASSERKEVLCSHCSCMASRLR